MKSPAFQWYAADYLADERVMLLSLESEAAYVRLLNYCWREGSIPAKPELCVPMCKYADVKVIKPALALFIKSPSLPGRLIHKRLEEERAKQESFREKQAENGKRGGRPRKATANPDETQTKGLGFFGETQMEPKKSSSSSTSSSNTSNDVAPPVEVQQPPKSLTPEQQAVRALTDPDDEQHWSVGPLTKPHVFKVICERHGYLDIDFEYYRRAALVAAEDDDTSRTIKQWNTWVRRFLENQGKGGPLLKPTAGHTLPSKPTPKDLLPKPGQETPGQRIYIDGVPGDQNMDRMKAASYLKHFPKAVVVSLAYPQNPYQNQPGR
ncbi:DUF1376 domain-containing protein [Hymenobacter sediminis]|uniref:DUF1376 domain-containing protein n=1 Tax=Hymenobacter sediminis TaxID=2218621 RepID=UPI000DA66C15|nr:DUF1376 domain-containing protein [Hymenobacter sediminis]RPD50032.1 DUF1376 domain-containing protein [Hymenobacter sediminis]